MTPEPAPTNIAGSGGSIDTTLLIALFLAIIPIFLCFTSCALFMITAFSLPLSSEQPINPPSQNVERVITETFDPQSTLDLGDIIIDPYTDEELTAQFLESSKRTFQFSFDDNTNGSLYGYEKNFLLANTQYQYERLSIRFRKELEDPISFILTDDQSKYELELGFLYDSQLQYAGLTKLGMIMILISPERDYDKADLVRLITHELVHAYQFDSEQSIVLSSPLWFTEGTAEYYSSQSLHYDPTLFRSTSNLNTLEDVDKALHSSDLDQALSAYVVAHSFIEELVQLKSEEDLSDLMLDQDKRFSFIQKFINHFGATPAELYHVWYTEKFMVEWFSLNKKPKTDYMLYNTLTFE
ncbi:hypothetical protein H6763_00685 [Candidatus Nomurabacteria bacterium]|nr:hypothetical protein [Candidatus Nomurabacteria bacterium]MCB9803328.1 hypothetical protein [Candidatus Nomurabacteria bacterium]